MTTAKQYRLQKRTEARELRDFVPRTTGPFYSTISGPSSFDPLLFVDNGQVMKIDQASVTALTRTQARELVIATYSAEIAEDAPDVNSLVFADRKSLRAFRSLAGDNTDPYGDENLYAAPIRAFDLMSSLKMSQSLKVLTDILKHRWWLPAGMTESDAGSWLGAPTISGANVPARLRSLEKIVRAEPLAGLTGDAALSSVHKVERSLFKSTNFGGVRTRFSQLRDTRNHGGHVRHLQRLAPGVQEELSLSGDLTCAEVKTQLTKNDFEMAVHGSTKLYVGKRVNVYTGRGEVLTGDAAVESFKMVNGNVSLVLSGRVLGRISPADVVYLGEKPYISRGAQFPNQKWIGTEPYQPSGDRLMPTDVFAAGGEF